MKQLLTFLIFFWTLTTIYAQDEADSSAVFKPLMFSVEEDLLNLPRTVKEDIRIYSSSKKLEKKDDALWSVSLLTKEQIQQSGAIYIAEALRLLPNVLVRQKGNGHYDVRIKGFAFLLEESFLQEANENNLLLLLDNMPLHQAFNNEIHWESIPVGIYDIEKIEVLTAPLGTLYGQNVLTGIIHIFSKQAKADGFKAQANVQAGSAQTYFNNIAVQYGFNEKLNIRLSGNYISNRRFQDNYFVLPLGRETSSDSLLLFQSNARETNLYTTLANQNYNVNAAINYQPNQQSYLQATLATQNTFSQDLNLEVGTFAQTIKRLKQHYIALNGKFKKVLFHANYQMGNQNLALGYNGYQFRTAQLNTMVEYPIILPKFSFVPSFHANHAVYNEQKPEATNLNYSESLLQKATLANVGFAARSEIALKENWKILGAVRGDFFNIPSSFILNLTVGTNIKIDKKNVLRIGYTTANKAPTIYHNFFSSQQIINSLEIPVNITQRTYQPNTVLHFTRSSNAEISWLWQYSDKLELNTQLFFTNVSQAITPSIENIGEDKIVTFTNSNQVINQAGINFLAKTYIKKFQISMFATLQGTSTNYIFSSMFANTPRIFGGFVVNYSSLFNKLNFNISGYGFQQQHFEARQAYKEAVGTQFVLNAKLSYRFWKEQTLFINIRNWKPSPRKEYMMGEYVLPVYLVGINLTL
jgi:iron complex outermembrane receptor protein